MEANMETRKSVSEKDLFPLDFAVRQWTKHSGVLVVVLPARVQTQNSLGESVAREELLRSTMLEQKGFTTSSIPWGNTYRLGIATMMSIVCTTTRPGAKFSGNVLWVTKQFWILFLLPLSSLSIWEGGLKLLALQLACREALFYTRLQSQLFKPRVSKESGYKPHLTVAQVSAFNISYQISSLK